ncbi:IDEAL domain-containing protein [Saliterribacillus persicus]|uniref:IDEAL domain-containing protein n=1 Tax=Saliterribacillus persicus TaxID=930114 RepID=A0A368Y979_9BACI|nr:IDEAL domain-containing protein [Saliterribacillus persicus]RCW74744.1 IDEAL domain-containing protein [Saliterribacillus persicus]
MVSIKMFKPYYVKEEGKYIRVVLAYQYFSLVLDGGVYHFVPLEAREIRFNRETQKIENEEAVFVFQKGKSFNRISLAELIQVEDFQEHLANILRPHLTEEPNTTSNPAIDEVIYALEHENIKRLIDQALINKDQKAFMFYSNKLIEM